jgi:hypothetical protein
MLCVNWKWLLLAFSFLTQLHHRWGFVVNASSPSASCGWQPLVQNQMLSGKEALILPSLKHQQALVFQGKWSCPSQSCRQMCAAVGGTKQLSTQG